MTGLRQRLWGLKPPVLTLAERARLGLPTIAVLIGFAVGGHFLTGLLVGLGTYTVLFGTLPDRHYRARVMLVAGIGLLLSVCLGVAAADSLALTLVVYVTVGLAAAAVDHALPLGPPGPYFFLLMAGAGGVVGAAGMQFSQTIWPVAVGTVIAFTAAVADPDKARMPTTPRRPVDLVVLLRVLVAVVVVFRGLTLAGDEHPFWAVLVVVLVLSLPGDNRTLGLRTLHRVGGTLLGFLAYWAWTLIHPPHLVDFIAMGILLWITMALAPRNYGYACIAITLLALIMTQALMPDVPPRVLATERVLDTLIGGGVAIAAMHLIRRRSAVPVA